MIIQSRRNFIIGLTSALAAPAIVRVQNIMPVKVIDRVMTLDDYYELIFKPMIRQLDKYNKEINRTLWV